MASITIAMWQHTPLSIDTREWICIARGSTAAGARICVRMNKRGDVVVYGYAGGRPECGVMAKDATRNTKYIVYAIRQVARALFSDVSHEAGRLCIADLPGSSMRGSDE